MGTNIVQIFYGGTVCASGCTATGAGGLPSGNFTPTAFIGLEWLCTVQMTATSVIVCDNSSSACAAGTNTVVYQTGPFGAGQVVTEPYGGTLLSAGLVVVLQAAANSNCFLKVMYR